MNIEWEDTGATLYGGAWLDSAAHLRPAYYDYTKVVTCCSFLGFRIKLRKLL